MLRKLRPSGFHTIWSTLLTEWNLEGSASHTLWGMSVCANDDQPCEVDLWRPDYWAAYSMTAYSTSTSWWGSN